MPAPTVIHLWYSDVLGVILRWRVDDGDEAG